MRGSLHVLLGVGSGLPAAAAPVSISTSLETSPSGFTRQVRLSGREGGVSFAAQARRPVRGKPWARWSAAGRAGSDRWILGSVRGWNFQRGVGWGDALAARGVRASVGPGLGASASGVTWVAGGRRSSRVVGIGRDPRGGPAGVLRFAGEDWVAGWEWGDRGPRVVGAWGSSALSRGQPRCELAVERGRGGEARLGVGGGAAPLGALLETVADRGRATEWKGEVAARTAGSAATTRFRAGFGKRGSAPARSRLSVEWERALARSLVLLEARCRRGAGRGAGSVVATLRSGSSLGVSGRLRVIAAGPRAERAASASVSGGSRTVRLGFVLEAPARSRRRGSVWLSRIRGRNRIRIAADWRGGRAPRLEVEWTASAGSGN